MEIEIEKLQKEHLRLREKAQATDRIQAYMPSLLQISHEIEDTQKRGEEEAQAISKKVIDASKNLIQEQIIFLENLAQN